MIFKDIATQTENDERKQRKRPISYREESSSSDEPNYFFPDEEEYYNSLSRKKQRFIDNVEKKIADFNYVKTPMRFKILESDMDISLKALAINKIEKMCMMDTSSGEYAKLNNWIEHLCKLPINNYKTLPITSKNSFKEISEFLTKTESNLNAKVFGHADAKQQIVKLLAKWISNPKSKGLVIGIEGAMGVGKCHGKDTLVIMYDGTLKKVQDIEQGDLLMGDDMTPRHVLSITSGIDDLYQVVPENEGHEPYIVNSAHILCLLDQDQIVTEISVRDYLNSNNAQDFKGYRATTLEFQKVSITVDPYFLGANLINLQVIPDNYKINTLDIRYQVLSGIIDNYCEKIENHWVYIKLPDHLIVDVLFISRSLGFLACYCPENTIKITGCFCALNLRKINISSAPTDVTYSTPIKLVYQGVGEYYGFMINDNQRYLLHDMTVTHNTTLCNGICESLDLPFGFVQLGGISDGSYLVGHSYTYEGSRWGKIAEILMKVGCMNPVLYFDELDKISNTRHGEEIVNLLIHLTDSSQNDKFHDKYFSDIEFDLSKCLMIFSYNNAELINPILRDRMITIKTSGYTHKDKLQIALEYMLPEIYKEYAFAMDEIQIDKETITHVINITQKEQGVRNLKRNLEEIVSQINLKRLFNKSTLTETPFKITKEIVDTFIKQNKTCNYNMIYT
jgi:hypothetical protein